jgi:hypothetical protein
MASSRIVAELVGGIYSGRNQRGVRQRPCIKISPRLDASAATANVNALPAKQAFLNALEFIEVSQRFARASQDEELAFHKPSGDGGKHYGGEILASHFVELGSNSSCTDELDVMAA